VRRIVTVTDAAGAVLRRRSRAVPQVDASIRRLIADMAVTMRHAEGVGLAAVQIGVPLRVILADTGRGLLALVNPRLRRRSGADVADEGCLSVPGVVAPVRRAARVTVDGTLVTGQRVGLRATGYVARILQHEIDHLNGVLFLDRVRASAVRRRALRPGERRRGVKTAATRLTAVAEAGRARRRSAGRRRSAPGRTRGSASPWLGSALTVTASSRRPAVQTGPARS
jgi:peptide deformylase